MNFKCYIIVLFLVISACLKAQSGFIRFLETPTTTSISEVVEVEEGVLRLRFRPSWPESIKTSIAGYYAFYYPAKDSLGHLEPIYKIMNEFTGIHNAHKYVISKEEILLSYQTNENSAAAREGILFDFVDLSDTNKIEMFGFYHMLGAFNPIVHQDSVFILHDPKPHPNGLIFPYGTDTMVLSYYNRHQPKVIGLDTLHFPQKLTTPGSLFYHPDRRQFELLYDSLHFIFSRGKSQLDTSFSDYGDFLADTSEYLAVDDLFGRNIQRHLNLFNDSCWYIYDPNAINMFWNCKNRQGDFYTRPQVPEWPMPNCVDCWIIAEGVQANELRSFALFDREDSTYVLYRSQDDSILNQLSLKRFPNYFRAEDIYALADGAYYLSGFTQMMQNDSAYYTPTLVYVDAQGNYSSDYNGGLFSVHFDSNQNHLKIFIDQPGLDINYRILDASGRSLKEGEIIAHQGIQLGDWCTGIYYLQLWEPNGDYLGQSSFLKTN